MTVTIKFVLDTSLIFNTFCKIFGSYTTLPTTKKKKKKKMGENDTSNSQQGNDA